MHLKDIQSAVIAMRKKLDETHMLLKNVELDLQDQNGCDDLEKRLKASGELMGILDKASKGSK